MAYRKKTLRRMSPTARKVARLAGELTSVVRRLQNLIPDLQRLDLDRSKALINAKAQQMPRSICPDCWIDYTGSGLDRCQECGRPLAFPSIRKHQPEPKGSGLITADTCQLCLGH